VGREGDLAEITMGTERGGERWREMEREEGGQRVRGSGGGGNYHNRVDSMHVGRSRMCIGRTFFGSCCAGG